MSERSLKFKQLGAECTSKEWVSQKLNNGEFNYWLVIQIVSVEEYMERGGKFYGRVSAVAPSQLPEDQLERVCYPNATMMAIAECAKLDAEDEIWLVDQVFNNGVSPSLWQNWHNNALSLLLEAYKAAEHIECRFGYYMDNACNRMGATGWDLIRGDVHGEYFRRKIAALKAA